MFTQSRLLALVTAVLLNLAGAASAAPERSADAKITEQVRSAIFARPALVGDDVSVQTHDGVVYLHGLVDTNVERELAESIAHDTPGVTRVVNALELRNDFR